MRKLFRGAFVMALVLGLGACGNQKKQPEEKFDETVITDTSVPGYALLGPDALYVGDQQLAFWGDYDGSVGTMQATSIANVSRINEAGKELARTLTNKKLKGLYMIQNIHVGDKALTGSMEKYGDDEKELDQVYTLKCGTYVVDPDTQKHAVDTWIPSKESGKVQSLTSNYWVTSNYAEDPDTHGYDWNTNPKVTSGAGVYTMVVARYSEQVDGAGFGIGVVLQESKPEFTDPVDHYQITGTINSWNNNTTDTKYIFAGDVPTLTYTFAANDIFRVTSVLQSGKATWGGYGFSDLQGAPATWTDAGSDNNIKITEAGSFQMKIQNDKIVVTPAN